MELTANRVKQILSLLDEAQDKINTLDVAKDRNKAEIQKSQLKADDLTHLRDGAKDDVDISQWDQAIADQEQKTQDWRRHLDNIEISICLELARIRTLKGWLIDQEIEEDD